MGNTLVKLFVVLVLVTISNSPAFAVEESIDLDAVAAPPKTTSTMNSALEKLSIMGRVDLTFENAEQEPTYQNEEHNLDNKHMLVFLKVKASPKTSFMGEIVSQSFYYVDYKHSDLFHFQFGKILVPFGDTRRFHHFYGGIQGYGENGVMFPNVWAESGFNIGWRVGGADVDTYVVNSVESEGATPDLHGSGSRRQAVGLRWTKPLLNKVTAIVSGYSGHYRMGKSLLIGGLDLYTDYGSLDRRGFKNIRVAAGLANAAFEDAPTLGNFEERGDYLELATNGLPVGELRVRYGTFNYNYNQTSSEDKHNWNIGYSFDVDVIHILTEYQWNLEAQNETKNDVFRIMASLDF